MTPVELCEFVDGLNTPILNLKDPHATHLLLELSSLCYSLAEGGDVEIEMVKNAFLVLQDYIFNKI